MKKILEIYQKYNRDKLKIHPIKFVDEVFTIALKTKPVKIKPNKKTLGLKRESSDISKNLQ